MPRFFMEAEQIGRDTAVISGGDAEHIKVLRLKTGDELTVCDGRGTDYRCRIRRFAQGLVETEILSSGPCPAEPSVRCTILAGLPKQGERADYIVQKCVESGAAEIVFFLCKRCVARPDAKGLEKKLQRWQRIAEEAAKQSGRGVIPQVGAVTRFAEALDLAKQTELPLFMYETGERVTLKSVLDAAGAIRTAAIITGPEGGFEAEEAAQAAAAGIRLCSMGPRILRCETAPVTALTALMYASGNL